MTRSDVRCETGDGKEIKKLKSLKVEKLTCWNVEKWDGKCLIGNKNILDKKRLKLYITKVNIIIWDRRK